MYETIIGLKNKGKLVPESTVKLLIEQGYTSASAVVAAMDDDIFLHRWDTPITLEDFMNAQKEAEGLDLGFVFTKAPEVSVESRQPFVVVKSHDDKKVICVALIAGTFPQVTPPKSAHSPPYHLKERIQKKLDRLYHSANDINGFRKLLGEGEFAEDLDLLTAPDGIVMFMTYDGADPITHGQPADIRGEFNWGRISHVVEKLAEKKEEPAKEEPKKTGLFGKLTGSRGTPSVPPTQKTEAPKADTAVDPKKADTAVDVANTIEWEMWKPAVGLKTKAFNRLMSETLGCVPHGAWEAYSKGASFPRPVNKAKFKHSNLYEQFRKAAAESTDNRVPSSTLIQVTKPASEDAPKVDTPNVAHVVGTEGKKHFSEKYMKRPSVMQAVAESRELVLNPKVLSKLDNKASTSFAEQSGLKQGVLDTLGWSEEDIQSFLKEEDPRLVFLWARDLQLQVISNLSAKREGKEGITTEVKPDGTMQAPQKSKLFGGMRKVS